MFAKFKEEIIDFLKGEEEISGICYKNVSFISKYNRIDLCEIVYSETEAFNGIDWSLDLAAEFGNLEVVKYLTRMGASCSKRAMDGAATNVHLDIIQWLHLNRSERCSSRAMDRAAKRGHIETVKYLIENKLVNMH